MEYNNCILYGLTRKRDLKTILKNNVKNKNNFNVQYKPYITNTPKKRLIEAPSNSLKIIQKRIKRCLDNLSYKENVFSGIKGRSYIDNAYYHIESNYFLKMDISKFFPNTSREKIFKFYNEKLNISNDIASILTDLSSINLENIITKEIQDFINEKGIQYTNHLPSGSPISSILSYLANIDMFNELENLAKQNDLIVSFYVDDIIFSGKKKISKSILHRAERIIDKHGQVVNKTKTKTYITNDFKKVTGCIIKNHELYIPNKTKYKIAYLLKKENYANSSINSILGLINNAQMFDKEKYRDLQYKLKNNKRL